VAGERSCMCGARFQNRGAEIGHGWTRARSAPFTAR
jgi:hypothetical protein